LLTGTKPKKFFVNSDEKVKTPITKIKMRKSVPRRAEKSKTKIPRNGPSTKKNLLQVRKGKDDHEEKMVVISS